MIATPPEHDFPASASKKNNTLFRLKFNDRTGELAKSAMQDEPKSSWAESCVRFGSKADISRYRPQDYPACLFSSSVASLSCSREGKSMISLLLSAAAVAAQPQLDCKNAMTQTDITICAGRRAKAADAVMISEYKIVMAVLRKMDRNIDRKSDKRPSYSAALLASQRAWLKFRQAECVIEGYAARGGSMEPMIVNSCFEEVTRERAKQLQALLMSYSSH